MLVPLKKVSSRFFLQVHNLLEAERPQWFLWVPVAIGTGISVYFSLGLEPSGKLLATSFLALCSGAFLCRRSTGLFLLLAFVTLAAGGMAAARFRTWSIATPMLHQATLPQFIEGKIEKIEILPGYQRLTLTNLKIDNADPACSPRGARLSFRGRMLKNGLVQPGMHVRFKAVLMPPSEPVAPGAYDFRRRAFFEGLGAVGYALHSPQIIIDQDTPFFYRKLQDKIQKARHALTMQLRQQLKGMTGEIAAALVTGDRSGITESLRQHYADAGIAHILAISGLHLSIVAGVVFFFIRGGLALIPVLALRYPVKKWAAGGAMLCTLVYLVICGAPISAQRAFIMTWLVLLGILGNRSALTLRNVALAATVILVLFPEALTSPSFQLSFSAVIALVAGYEVLQPRLEKWYAVKNGVIYRFCLYALGIVLSTLLATFATTPYIVHTFHRFTLHAIPANLLAIPLTSFIIMPGLVLMLVLMPLEMDGFLHKLLEVAIGSLSYSAETISKWPGSVILIPATSNLTIGLLTFGGLMLALLKTRLRRGGGVLVVAGLISIFFTKPPDMFISADQKVIGIRSHEESLWVTDMRSGRFARSSWFRMMGRNCAEKLPAKGEINQGEIICHAPHYDLFNRYGISAEKAKIKIVDHIEHKTLIDSSFLHRHGGTFLWLRNASPLSASVREPGYFRPWTLRPESLR